MSVPREDAMSQRFPHGATWAPNVEVDELTEEERVQIQAGTLGYCEGHAVLYKKWALHSCLVPLIFEDSLGIECKEWPAHE